VLFGIDIKQDGSIYFVMSSKIWFDKIFSSNSYGVSVDLVSKDKYVCGAASSSSAENFSLPKGKIISPVYRNELLKNKLNLNDGHIYVKVGQVPAELKSKQLEGNLIIVNGNNICFYSNFIDIDRNVWQLLPMGLFTDSLIQNNKAYNDSVNEFFTYSKQLQFEIPFEKGSTQFNSLYLKRFYDSLGINKYVVKKAEVRAYSSIEGSEKINRNLMNKRASIVVEELKKIQPSLTRIKVITAENWVDFFTDIEDTDYADFLTLSKIEIKQQLTDKTVLSELEEKLSKERKAIVTLYVEPKLSVSKFKEAQLLSDFKSAVESKDITKAAEIQKELVNRIIDNKLPFSFLSKLEVPQVKEFSTLLNDREVYKYLLKATTEYEALEKFLEIQKLEPNNGRLNYNICALRFFVWQNNEDSSVKKILLKEIMGLQKQNISKMLVKRMLINYNILKCEEDMLQSDYKAKDSSLNYIRTLYREISLNDEDIYSLAKYFTSYAHRDWAEEIIKPRVSQINVSEDLIFYYINLQFYNPSVYASDDFQKSLLNAINLNPKRFCNFFLPNYSGGASMQLLDYEELKGRYCETCR
jgi:hypothetical protein